ncbi:MAG: RDD family protein [Cardiobacteriaceae bacterium]|nr:RDD family protein [Cardiobacteriaceae bacterium]
MLQSRSSNELIDDSFSIQTPEGVELFYLLADPISRAIAFVLDGIFISIGVFLLPYCLMLLGFFLFPDFFFEELKVMKGIGFIGIFLFSWGYFFLSEWLFNGTTLGKKIMNLRVVSDNFCALDASQSAWRNVLRYLDLLPFAGGIGLISMLVTDKNQRLGDYLAGTVVVFRNSESVLKEKISSSISRPPPFSLNRDEARALIDFAIYAENHDFSRLAEMSAPFASFFPADCTVKERVEEMLAWGNWLYGKK